MLQHPDSEPFWHKLPPDVSLILSGFRDLGFLNLCWVWATPIGAQGLFLILPSKFTPGGFREPSGVLGIEPGPATCKASALFTVLLLQAQPVLVWGVICIGPLHALVSP